MRANIAIRHNAEVTARDQEALARYANEAMDVHDGLYKELTADYEFTPNYYIPTPSIGLVEWVFQALQKTISHQGEIDGGLRKFFNTRLLPLSGAADLSAEALHTATLSKGALGYACSSSEDFFYDLLAQIRSGRYYGQGFAKVYHDYSGDALILRKARDERTGLMLRPVKANGLLVPAGTIVAVGRDADQEQTGEKSYMHYETSTYLVDDSVPIFPRRLSSWAYSNSIDRAGFAISCYYEGQLVVPSYNLARGRKLERTSIEDFRGAANKVLASCGVTQL